MAFLATNLFSSSLPADAFLNSELKFNGEDPFATIFSPVQVEDTNMMIEETPNLETHSTTANEESLFEVPPINSDASDSQEDNRSKDGLKFCRKLSTLMLEVLKAPNDVFHQIMTFSSQVLLSLLSPLNLHGVSSSQIRELQYECLERLWAEFKELLSYSKNKKICIVKQEYWNMIFDKKGCTTQLKQIFETLSKIWKTPAAKLVLSDTVFCELFAHVLFYSNKLAVTVLILKDSSDKGNFLRNLKTIDNFFMMVLLPDLMQFYNHRRGKFALECCRKCKICKSKQIPSDFLIILNDSRTKIESVVSIINQIFLKCGSNSFETGSRLVEFGFTQL
jgi:hypothetical protein